MKLCRGFIALITVLAAALAAEGSKVPAAEAAKRVAAGKAVLVDCREPGELKDSPVAAPAVLLPKSDFDGDQAQWKEFLARNKDREILIYCRSGGRSGAVASALNEKGIKAGSIGGLSDWTKAGLPTRPSDQPPKPAKN